MKNKENHQNKEDFPRPHLAAAPQTDDVADTGISRGGFLGFGCQRPIFSGAR